MHALPKMEVFENVPVVPPPGAVWLMNMVDGGPIWPDFENQKSARHNRGGIPVDILPEESSEERIDIDEPCVWIGFAHWQFGHLVGEFLTRLPLSIRERPDDLYLFVAEPGKTAASLPRFFWDLIDWYGLRRDRVLIVTTPVTARELRVAPQGEHLPFCPPEPYYIELLEQISERNGLLPEKANLVYVTRAGMMSSGNGGHAGESYLVDRLKALGVSVMDPGSTKIRDQLAIYAGTDTLIFAEGSALHGRQILGRVDQKIIVLRRAPDFDVAKKQVGARCRDLKFVSVISTVVTPLRKNGREFKPRAFSVYDLDALFGAFLEHGVDLKPIWNQTDFARAQESDIRDWFEARYGVGGNFVLEPGIVSVTENTDPDHKLVRWLKTEYRRARQQRLEKLNPRRSMLHRLGARMKFIGK